MNWCFRSFLPKLSVDDCTLYVSGGNSFTEIAATAPGEDVRDVAEMAADSIEEYSQGLFYRTGKWVT